MVIKKLPSIMAIGLKKLPENWLVFLGRYYEVQPTGLDKEFILN